MKILEGVSRFKICLNIKDASFFKSCRSSCPGTQHCLVEMVDVKCLVKWQDLSLQSKASSESLKVDHTQSMSSI